MQRACRSLPSAASGGMAVSHAATCRGQRGAKAQPGGGSNGLHTWPLIAVRRGRVLAAVPRAAMPGRLAYSPRGWGFWGAAYIGATAAVSTMRPAYITAT